MANTFFATKISFLNDMKILSEKVNANWDDVIEGFVRDGRVIRQVFKHDGSSVL